MMHRQYVYVGSHALRRLLDQPALRSCIRHPDDFRHWFQAAQPPINRDKTVTVTFIIDTDGQLWIADRGIEHVVCAVGQPVLSAGEMTFAMERPQTEIIEIVEITNQSTGYCPEPESWWAVERALTDIGIPHPPDFTVAYLFRRCDVCGTTNIIKDLWFECAVCESPLSQDWNYDR